MIADDSLAGTQEDLVLNLCALFLNILKTLGYPKQRILYWDEKQIRLWENVVMRNRPKIVSE